MDGIRLGILWSSLVSLVSDQARALQRIAFSPIVREAGDLGVALFDARGRAVAQAVTGTPGHINSLANAGPNFLAAVPPDTMAPGDVLVTNDPWLTAGHFFDITVFQPVFHRGRLVAFFGATAHHTDIGGYGLGAGARDVHEEGLWIPIERLYIAGAPNRTLHNLIRHNVRTPEAVFGDLAAQVSAGRVGGERLVALLARHGLDDLEGLAGEILRRSERATRAAIRGLRPGTYHGATAFDVPGGEVVDLRVALTVDAGRGEVLVDFAGSSGASASGINVCLNYTQAYATFAVRSCLNPELPNNAGSLAPIRVVAPHGCIVNAAYPSPVNARHVVGMYVGTPVLNALHQVLPDRVLAEGAGAVWTVQVQGRDTDGLPFTSSVFNYSGGMGARRTKDGPAATCYPAGVAAVPVEILEASFPIEFTCKELRPGSGGPGRTRGGDGQRIGFRMRTRQDWVLNAIPARLRVAPAGLEGGAAGAPGRFLVNGEPVSVPRRMTMRPDDEVLLETPGGGGYGPPAAPSERPGEAP